MDLKRFLAFLLVHVRCCSIATTLKPPCLGGQQYFGRYFIRLIARSIDPAPIQSDNKSTMGPGLAVVGTPGSPSDVARSKVLLPRPLADSVRVMVRLSSVAIYWVVHQRH